ANSNNPDWDFN
nr:Chain P, PreS1/PreS2/surface protein [synthetic construct]